jgi:hypothetical protein
VCSPPHDAAPKATGPVVLGRYRWGDWSSGFVHAEIADARVWNRALVTDDINGTDANAATGVPAQIGLTRPMEVASYQFADGECYCTDTLDGSYFARTAALKPSWTGDPLTSPAWLTNDSHDGNGGVQLNGSSGYLTTNNGTDRPALRTDQSITFTAWVKLDQVTSVDQVILNQGPFFLFFRGWEGKWGATMRQPNGSGGYINVESYSAGPAVAGQWVHLAGIFNASTGDVSLYVNGVKQPSVGHGAVGAASTTSLLIGNRTGTNSYFGGTIDTVHVYQGVVNGREIATSYAGI